MNIGSQRKIFSITLIWSEILAKHEIGTNEKVDVTYNWKSWVRIPSTFIPTLRVINY